MLHRMQAHELPSNNRVRQAGETLRTWLQSPSALEPEDYREALRVIEAHRAAHAMPMLGANVSLRRMCRTLGLVDAKVTQRLKRMETIKDKLLREPGLRLDRMQDLGGCRVVVASIDQIYALRDRIVRYHPDAREKDYVAEPRSSGYRALHIVAAYGRTPRKRIEVQLRTEMMHRWADLVEGLSGALGVNYKQDGDSDLQRAMQFLSQWMDLVESDAEVPESLVTAYNDVWKRVFPQ